MRGKKAPKRKTKPDRVYESEVIGKFINYVMLHGKKSTAEDMVYSALEDASTKLKKKPPEVLNGALANVKPVLEIRSRRVGGANYQIPMPVPEDRQVSLALRWIVNIARGKKGKEFKEFLADELISAFKGEGAAVKKKEEVEKMAEANKAFAHFRW